MSKLKKSERDESLEYLANVIGSSIRDEEDIGSLAHAVDRIADAIHRQVETQDGLHRIAEAILELAAAVRSSRSSKVKDTVF